MIKPEFLKILERLPLSDLKRIDVALEGDWSSTVATIWKRDEGFIGFSKVAKSHKNFQPSLELYFDGLWLGIHCYKSLDGENVFDEQLARSVVQQVDALIK